jgi:GTP-binding protein EngB required for normal cell division
MALLTKRTPLKWLTKINKIKKSKWSRNLDSLFPKHKFSRDRTLLAISKSKAISTTILLTQL